MVTEIRRACSFFFIYLFLFLFFFFCFTQSTFTSIAAIILVYMYKFCTNSVSHYQLLCFVDCLIHVVLIKSCSPGSPHGNKQRIYMRVKNHMGNGASLVSTDGRPLDL